MSSFDINKYFRPIIEYIVEKTKTKTQIDQKSAHFSGGHWRRQDWQDLTQPDKEDAAKHWLSIHFISYRTTRVVTTTQLANYIFLNCDFLQLLDLNLWLVSRPYFYFYFL